MSIRVAINGFGRIGRLTFRILMARSSEFEVVAINDLTDNRPLAMLLKYDSTHGRYDATVDYDDQNLIVNGTKIRALAVRNPAELPWKELEVDVVVESTGIFTSRASDGKAGYDTHLAAAPPKAVLSAPAHAAAHDGAAHLPKEHDPTTVDNVGQERLGLWTAVDAAKKFMGYEGPRILTLSGDTGVGKSHLAEAIARSFLASGMSVRYEFVPELVLSLQAASNPRNWTQVEDILAPAKDAGLLWLDDFGEEKPSDFTALHLTNLVEDRIRRNALMVVTTNKSRENMREDFKPNPGEPGLYFRLASRLFDVHTGTVRVVTIEAKDFRGEGS